MRLTRTLFLYFMAFVISGCATVPSGHDVEASWSKAKVFVPNQQEVTAPNRVRVSGSLPVVIYLHGCTGINSHSTAWANYIRNLGFAVVLPDSFARQDRGASCDGVSKKHYNPSVPRLRAQEAVYALYKLQAEPWVEARNIFLMGHSEGGVAAARTLVEGFNGVIVSGWTCTDPNSYLNGLLVPSGIPILTMIWDGDPWFYGTGYQGSCASHSGGRTNVKNLIFPGIDHDTFNHAAAREAVEAFLRDNRKR